MANEVGESSYVVGIWMREQDCVVVDVGVFVGEKTMVRIGGWCARARSNDGRFD